MRGLSLLRVSEKDPLGRRPSGQTLYATLFREVGTRAIFSDNLSK